MSPGRIIAGAALLLAACGLAGCGRSPAPESPAVPEPGAVPLAVSPVPGPSNTPSGPGTNLSVAVRQVIGQEGERNIASRMRALREAAGPLAPAEQEELLRFVEGSGPVEGLSEESARWLKNDIMNRLCAQETPSPRLGEALAQIYRDAGQDPVLRDYALQHLGGWRLRESDAGRQAVIDAVLWDAARERAGTFGGTALIALGRVAQSGGLSAGEAARLDEAALAAAGDAESSLASRVTAMQLCARRGVAAALPLARELASGHGDLSLRISALAALGRLGGPGDLAVLEGMVGGPEPRLEPAARAAMKQIKSARTTPQTAVQPPAGKRP